jgi:hypothetical protein
MSQDFIRSLKINGNDAADFWLHPIFQSTLFHFFCKAIAAIMASNVVLIELLLWELMQMQGMISHLTKFRTFFSNDQIIFQLGPARAALNFSVLNFLPVYIDCGLDPMRRMFKIRLVSGFQTCTMSLCHFCCDMRWRIEADDALSVIFVNIPSIESIL